MLVVSSRRWALMVDLEAEREPALRETLDRLDQSQLDVILVEGFKHEAFPKIELHRAAVGKDLLFPNDPDVIAVATDSPLAQPTRLPVLDLNDVEAIADFVESFCGKAHDQPRS